MTTGELTLETIRLTNKIRMYRVSQIRKAAVNMVLNHVQKQTIENLEKAVKLNNHYEIDRQLEEAAELIFEV